MFCPSCATEDRNQSQYCRACGTELHLVRTALQRPDAITNSDIAARGEIGRAIATKIEELHSANDLRHVVEDVLPQVEKFLESPEERRLRSARDGVITTAVGLGILLFFFFFSQILSNGHDAKILLQIGAGASMIVLTVGLALIINARWFTVPPKQFGRMPRDNMPMVPDQLITGSLHQDSPPAPLANPVSVTEGTTRQLR